MLSGSALNPAGGVVSTPATESCIVAQANSAALSIVSVRGKVMDSSRQNYSAHSHGQHGVYTHK